MAKITQKQVMGILQVIAIMTVGLMGANAALGVVKQWIPDNFKKYTPVIGVTAGMYGMLKAKGLLKQISEGATLFSVLNLINQVIPETSPLKNYLPGISGLGVTHTPLALGSAPTYYAPPTPALPEYEPFGNTAPAYADDFF